MFLKKDLHIAIDEVDKKINNQLQFSISPCNYDRFDVGTNLLIFGFIYFLIQSDRLAFEIVKQE